MTNGHLWDMELKKIKEQKGEISHGIINHKRTLNPRHPLHKIATEIEKYN